MTIPRLLALRHCDRFSSPTDFLLAPIGFAVVYSQKCDVFGCQLIIRLILNVCIFYLGREYNRVSAVRGRYLDDILSSS